MKQGSIALLFGLVAIGILIAWIVSPVAASGDQDPRGEKAFGDNKYGDDKHLDDGSSVPREGYNEQLRCGCHAPDSFSQIPDLALDSTLITATPHWIFLAAGEREQQALLQYLDNADIPLKKRAEWKRFLKGIWNKYPVRYVKTENSAKLELVNRHGKFSITAKENATFQEIEAYIALDMEKTQQNSIMPMFVDRTHSTFIESALIQDRIVTVGEKYYLGLVSQSAPEPDTWYISDPIPYAQQINHGFVPIGISILPFPFIILPPQIVGVGLAPDNYGKYTSLAKQEFASRDYYASFKDMAYASHFISDLGNPYHTPMVQIIPLQFVDTPFSLIVFPNSEMILDYETLHNNYENYVADHYSSFSTSESYLPIDPTYSAKGHAVFSWAMSYPLIYSCYWHFLINHNYDFTTNPAIVFITENRVIETAKHNNGLVQYVTGGKPITFTITPIAGSGGSISPSSPVTITYSESQTFSIQPALNYEIADVIVNGESKGLKNQFTFDIDTLDKSKGDQTIEVIFKSTAPLTPISMDVPSYSSGIPQYTVPEYGDELWSVMRSANGNELGSGLILFTGNAENEFRTLSRPVFVFRDPLSSLPSGATIMTETFVWYVPISYNTLWPYPFIELTDGSVSDPNEIHASDYQRAGSTALSDSYPVGWFGGSNPMELPLNAAGKSYIDSRGDVVVFVRFTSDVDGTSPDWSYLSRIYLEGFPEAYLHIEYLPPR